MRLRTRTLTLIALTGVATITLAGCSEEPDDGRVTLRFSWWGSESRQASTQEIIDAFEAKNPGIRIQPEYGDFGGYWDKLATQVASDDAPDVIQMDEKYLREYADRGALLELSGVDTSAMTEATVATGTTDEGVFGIPTGINAIAIMANPDLFEAAGVPLPDDRTWTWEDYADISRQILDSGAGFGATGPNEPATFQVWLRQQGKEMTTADGTLGFTVEDATAYLQMHKDLLDSGAYPAASILAEDQSPGPDQSLFGTGRAAMSGWWTNQMPALAGASGADVVPLRMPTTPGGPGGNQLFYKSSMFMSADSRTDHPEEVELFIDFMVNSEEAGRLNLADRGLPANLEVREAVLPELGEVDRASAEFLEEIESELGPDLPVPPLGFSVLQEAVYRYELDVLFGRVSPEDAGEQMHREMELAVS